MEGIFAVTLVVRIRDVLSRILIFFLNQDPGVQQIQQQGGGKIRYLTFFMAINFTELKIMKFFNRHRKRVD
jgi:hypothetical protein